ncbi:NUDIX domain-containing protein [Streptomyces sp. NPDC004111]|uniref:NUDIX domain-containing protein n=1 Tax=Streptomyces sp. NPDC004111 TaxID=3364690 RepID=UPI003680AE7A
MHPNPTPPSPPSPNLTPVTHTHCPHCGTPYPTSATTSWPRTCPSCQETTYRNPLPVAVALLPVHATTTTPTTTTTSTTSAAPTPSTGLLVITRTIEPQNGALALPGGFIDHAEDWRNAVVRELREETGIEAHAADVQLADALSSPTDHLLLFGLLPAVEESELPPSVPTAETAGWQVLYAPTELAFPLHTQAARAWFAGTYTRRP